MRIAVWNTAFLGDSVLTLPLIRVLKAAYPDAEIDFYVRGGLASLYEAQPELARVFNCDKRGKEKGLAAMLRQGREIRERGYADKWIGGERPVTLVGINFNPKKRNIDMPIIEKV